MDIIDQLSIAKAAISSSISPVAFVDCDKKKVVYVNHAFLSIWEYHSSDEILGRSASEFWKNGPMNEQIKRRIYDRGGWIGELIAFRKDGNAFPVQVSVTMLVDANSMPLFQMFSFIDISERINAQTEQRCLLENLQERIKELNCLYSILSIKYTNEATIESFLCRVVATIPPSLRWPEHSYARIVAGEIDVCSQNFKASSSLLSIPLRIGQDKGYLEVGYYPVQNVKCEMVLLKEEKVLLRAAAKEIERLIEQKRYEDELQSSRERLLHADKLSSIGVLSAEIMHEIGNPNNFIALNTRMLTKAWEGILPVLDMYYKETGDFAVAGLPFSEAREEVSRLLAGIIEGSERIRTISSNLKSFLARKNTNQYTVFKINDAVRKAIEFSRNIIESSTDNFQLILSEEEPMIKGDCSQIQQVVINLVTNACQALLSRKNLVGVSTAYDKKHDCINIVVEDEGKGIHQNDLSHVFDPFFTTKKDKNCTGLGLSISNDIAVNHGGKLLLHSVLNHGTRIILSLPDYKDGTNESV